MVAASGHGRTRRAMKGKVRVRREKGKMVVRGGVLKLVSLTEPVGMKSNNQPMMVMTESGDMRMQRAIERQVREARQEG